MIPYYPFYAPASMVRFWERAVERVGAWFSRFLGG